MTIEMHLLQYDLNGGVFIIQFDILCWHATYHIYKIFKYGSGVIELISWL